MRHGAKNTALVAGMVAGTDSITEMDLLRHAATVRPDPHPIDVEDVPTLVHLGHVRQLDAVAVRLLARLAAATSLLSNAEQLVFVDVDDTVRQTYGYSKRAPGAATPK